MPPILTTVIEIIQLGVQFAPVAEKIYENAHALFDMWFAGGLITADQQKSLHDWADAHEEAVLAGEVPPELVVQPDPK